MKVRVNGYYAGQLTKGAFFNVESWDKCENNDRFPNIVDITFKNVSSIEKLGDGLRIVFNACESHYFDHNDYATITIF